MSDATVYLSINGNTYNAGICTVCKQLFEDEARGAKWQPLIQRKHADADFKTFCDLISSCRWSDSEIQSLSLLLEKASSMTHPRIDRSRITHESHHINARVRLARSKLRKPRSKSLVEKSTTIHIDKTGAPVH